MRKPAVDALRGVMLLTVAITLLHEARAGDVQTATPRLSSIPGVQTETSIDFPRGIKFTVDLGVMSKQMDSSVELRYTVAGNETEHLVLVPENARSGAAGLIIDLSVDLQSRFVPSGLTLEYHWEVSSKSGEVERTKSENVTWFDTRWNWTTAQSSQVALHSYDLSPSFVQTILGSAQSTVTDLEDRFSMERSQPIDIWVYSSIDDFRDAQQPNSRESIAGASYPGFFLVVAVITEGDIPEVGRVIPHEISHQVLYQATRNPFTLPPLWFDEGLAVHYQTGGSAGYLEMVIAAHQQDRLFDLNSIDTMFPFFPAQATLAYATSWSAVEFIRQRFGDKGVERLIAAFANGDSFDTTFTLALGVSMTELNDQWQGWIERQAFAAPRSTATDALDFSLAA